MAVDGGRPDRWAPIGEGGRIEVRELLSPEAFTRESAGDRHAELVLARSTVATAPVEVGARWQARFARCAGTLLAELDLSGAPDPTGGYRKALTLAGLVGAVVLETDDSRRSRLRGALRFLRVEVDGRAWVWHFEGGRAAGERLVLSPGRLPGDGSALVTTYPSARGRSLGNPTGGASTDTHVTSWAPEASLVEVVLAELLTTAWLHGLVDYRPSRIAAGVGELIDLAPRPEANTT